jgi:hypothetical protein
MVHAWWSGCRLSGHGIRLSLIVSDDCRANKTAFSTAFREQTGIDNGGQVLNRALGTRRELGSSSVGEVDGPMATPPPRAVRPVTPRPAMPSRTSIVPLLGLPVKRRAYRPASSIGCCHAARPTRVSPRGPLYPPVFAIGPYPELCGASRSIISHVAEIVPLDAQRRGQPLGSASSISTCLHSAQPKSVTPRFANEQALLSVGLPLEMIDALVPAFSARVYNLLSVDC